MERDEQGKFLQGHQVSDKSIKALLKYHKDYGSYNKGKKFGSLPIKIKIKQSKTMQERHKNPTWNEKDRRNKISEKLIGHLVSKETRLKIKKKAKYSKKQGTNFEYRALHYIEKQEGVIQVIRSAGSHDIDLTVIWENGNSFLISKEEVKSSFKWFNTISQNPLCLLDRDDKEKLINAFNKGFEIFLIYREPKTKIKGGLMEKQSDIRRLKLIVKNGEVCNKN